MKELEESYELQQQCIQDLAVIARRALTSAHTTGGHSSKIYDCPDCVSDVFRIHLLGGLGI